MRCPQRLAAKLWEEANQKVTGRHTAPVGNETSSALFLSQLLAFKIASAHGQQGSKRFFQLSLAGGSLVGLTLQGWDTLKALLGFTGTQQKQSRNSSKKDGKSGQQ